MLPEPFLDDVSVAMMTSNASKKQQEMNENSLGIVKIFFKYGSIL